jgi:hypothetical protein
MDFPLFKIGKYENIEKTPLGKIYITTVYDKYVLDDTSVEGETLGQRRLKLALKGHNLYKFRGKVDTLKQLIKHPSGTIFLDNNGNIFKYRKGRKLFKVVSHKVLKRENKDDGVVVTIQDYPTPHFIPSKKVADNTNYVSIMLTNTGPLIYDYTSEPHKVYRRSL